MTPQWLEGRAVKVRRQLSKLLRADFEACVLSAEDISRYSPDETRELKRVLEAEVDHVEVMAYVRDARGFMESMFQQHLKGGSSRLNLGAQYPRYQYCFKKFDRQFGAEHVQLAPFKAALFPEKCVVRDFCQRTGLSVDPATIKRANEGMSREAASLLFTYRRLLGQDQWWEASVFPEQHANTALRVDRYLVSWFMQVKGAKLRFAPELLAPVLADKANDIAWMEDRLGGYRIADLGSAAPNDIRSETDLLTPGPLAMEWLAERATMPLRVGCSQQQLAEAFRVLRGHAITQVRSEGPEGRPIKVSV